MKPILVFYHCLFFRKSDAGTHQLPNAIPVIRDQMAHMAGYGLHDASTQIIVGVNGGDESLPAMKEALIPDKAQVVMHGLDSISETATMGLMQEQVRENPGCYVFYFHSQGVTHTDLNYIAFVARWRKCMTFHLIDHWQNCVNDLDSGYESVGCHWMINMSPPSDKDAIWGGNFWWATGDFLLTLPPLLDSALISKHGVNAPIARYEPERWIGYGPSRPRVKDYHVNGIGLCP